MKALIRKLYMYFYHDEVMKAHNQLLIYVEQATSDPIACGKADGALETLNTLCLFK